MVTPVVTYASPNASTAFGTSHSATIPAIAAGEAVLLVFEDGGSASVSGVLAGSVAMNADATINYPTFGVNHRFFSAIAPTIGGTTVSWNTSSSTASWYRIFKVTGLSGALDGSPVTATNPFSAAPSAGFTTTGVDSLALSVFINPGSQTLTGLTAGYTVEPSSGSDSYFSAYNPALGAAGAKTVAGTWGASTGWQVDVVVYAAAASGGLPSPSNPARQRPRRKRRASTYNQILDFFGLAERTPYGWFDVPLVNAVAGGGGIVADATDTITLSDSAEAITTRVAAATDTLTLSDSAVSQTSRTATASDTITLSDSAVSGVANTAAASDTITLSDSATAITNKVAAASDTVTLSDSATAITSRVAEASDTLTLTDSAVAVNSGGGIVADGTDTITLSDSATATVSVVAAATDTVTLSDSATAITSRVAAASDTVTLSDSATAITSRVATATDTIALSDAAVAVATLIANAIDSIALTDSAIASILTGAIIVDASDTITLSDSAVATKVPGTPSPAFGGGWVMYPNAVKPKKKKRTEEEVVISDTIQRRIDLEAAVRALMPAEVPKKAVSPILEPPPVVAVGVGVAQALQRLREDVLGVVTRAQVRESIAAAQAAVDEEQQRRARVKRANARFLLLD